MAYREQNGQVVLTMSREDFYILLRLLGGVLSFERMNPGRTILPWEKQVEFLNRLNEGNPHYTPYATQTEKSVRSPRCSGCAPLNPDMGC